MIGVFSYYPAITLLVTKLFRNSSFENILVSYIDDLTSQQQIMGNHQQQNIQQKQDDFYNAQHSSPQGETFTFFDSLKDDRSTSSQQEGGEEDEEDDKCNDDENDDHDNDHRTTSVTKKPLTVIKNTEKPKPKKACKEDPKGTIGEKMKFVQLNAHKMHCKDNYSQANKIHSDF